MKAVELFAGAGGLALGVGLAGFKPLAVVEWDKWACDTIRQNQERGYPLVADWPLQEGDVRDFDWSTVNEQVDLLAGGPPCQPFSMGGKHKAHDDTRDMFPATVEIVRRLRPRAFIIENVKGLTRASFASYFQYIQFQLEFPEVKRRKNETWFDHLMRLQAEHSSGKLHSTGLAYNIIPTLVNAANYGVPQKRERIFLVGFRSDLSVDWSFPEETHSQAALFRDQWITGEYWDRHKVAEKDRPAAPESVAAQSRTVQHRLPFESARPWRTIRDALVGLPDPQSKAARAFKDHRFQGGARSYPGHTGSPIDLPSKTLKAGGHGVPGGENMLVDNNGVPRYLTIREAARVQTFPDGFVFHGSWTETMRQLGNAVPVVLGHVVARSVAEALIAKDLSSLSTRQLRLRGVA
ncbi:DNA cytosine methyltransferase [Xylophilus ampelinus]|uniref:DNA (cytosine-5-)-methyltransferase n=1 Tax=Xylophilus ampelinus TaxID=54067 RepID=A0A318SEV9_9BURK|nr:DNA cytosine methyltransferase [Xylophilus ampelinus]MCS4511188.1 DNA cytosine methyltransferase [Xylophilus ampelinus]PYE75059.1 DNA (cytosine-5)-methyltransferase 1 [Xylophilus ampelinus]